MTFKEWKSHVNWRTLIIALSIQLLLILLAVTGCGDEGIHVDDEMPYFSLNKAAHEATYTAATTPHELRGIRSAPPIPDTGWTYQSIDAWEAMEVTGLDKQLADNLIDAAKHAELISDVHADAQHQRDRLLNINYHIYSGVANPLDGGLTNRRGWEVDVIYGKTLTPDDFLITISGDWKIEDFSSTEQDDESFVIYFFIASKSRRGIIDWRGLVQPIALDGNR